MFLEFKSKSPPSCGVVSSTTLEIPAGQVVAASDVDVKYPPSIFNAPKEPVDVDEPLICPPAIILPVELISTGLLKGL